MILAGALLPRKSVLSILHDKAENAYTGIVQAAKMRLGRCQSCRVLRSNSGQAKNSSKLMSKPSQIAYKVFSFTEVLLFFLIEESVVCGTPLRLDNSYFVMFRSMHNCSMRNATASSKSVLSPPLRIVVA